MRTCVSSLETIVGYRGAADAVYGRGVYRTFLLVRRVPQIPLETNRHKCANKNCNLGDIGCDSAQVVHRRQYRPSEAAGRTTSKPSSDAQSYRHIRFRLESGKWAKPGGNCK